jgi:hypothetical protein
LWETKEKVKKKWWEIKKSCGKKKFLKKNCIAAVVPTVPKKWREKNIIVPKIVGKKKRSRKKKGS